MKKLKDYINDCNYFNFNGGYKDLIECYGYEILYELRLGNYQGDLLFIVRKNNKYGFISTGFGSCSYCDNLEACTTLEDIEELQEKICKYVNFMSVGELITWLEKHDWAGDYYGEDDELIEWINKVKNELLVLHLAGI